MQKTEVGMLKKWLVKMFSRIENITEDVAFARALNPVPSFKEFDDFVQTSEKAKVSVDKHLPGLYDYHRLLNFAELTADSLINVDRDKETTEITPIITKVAYDSQYGRSIQIGQHNKENKLHGLGRRIWVSSIGLATIWEGQFKEDRLEGFGRCMKVQIGGKFNCKLGYYKEGWCRGYKIEKGEIEYGCFSAKTEEKKEENSSDESDEEKEEEEDSIPDVEKVDFGKYLMEM